MNTNLEEKLLQYEKNSPVTNDEEMIKALNSIIEEEGARPAEDIDTELIDEAVEMLLALQHVDTEELDREADRIASAFTAKIAETEAADKESAAVKTKKPSAFRWKTFAKRVAIFAVAVALVGAGIVGFNGEVRASLMDTIASWFSNFVNIDFTNETGESKTEDRSIKDVTDINDLIIGYIPEGFTLGAEDKMDGSIYYYYLSDTSEYFFIEFNQSSASQIDSDNEVHTKYSTTTINGIQAYILYSDEEKSGSIIFGNDHVTITIRGLLVKAELISIAQYITNNSK